MKGVLVRMSIVPSCHHFDVRKSYYTVINWQIFKSFSEPSYKDFIYWSFWNSFNFLLQLSHSELNFVIILDIVNIQWVKQVCGSLSIWKFHSKVSSQCSHIKNTQYHLNWILHTCIRLKVQLRICVLRWNEKPFYTL